MKHRFIKTSEKKQYAKALNEVYGIPDIHYLLVEAGKQKLKAYSGHLSKDEILELANLTNIDTMGMYLFSVRDGPDQPRLSFDATSLLRDFISKNIVDINDFEYEHWIRGLDLERPNRFKGYVAIRYKDDLVGIGKSNGEKIFNYIPRERKVKTPLKTQSTPQ